jgi:hypothetical protein
MSKHNEIRDVLKQPVKNEAVSQWQAIRDRQREIFEASRLQEEKMRLDKKRLSEDLTKVVLVKK